MLKLSHFAAQSEAGYGAIPLFGKADAEFEKCASLGLLPDVVRYIEALRPQTNSQYVLVNAMAAGEYFGCFPAGTLVETLGGERPIEEVGPGEKVLTHKNRYRPVLARVPRQADELCDLYVQGLPSNLPSLTATPNHELWVVTREDFLQTKRRVIWKGDTTIPVEARRRQAVQGMEFSWVPISDLRAGDYIAEPFPLEEDPKALGDEKWNCPDVAFLMGLYAAEGCVAYRYDRDDEKPASVIYVVSGDETAVIDGARKYAETLGYRLQDYVSESGTSCRLQLCFSEFARLCKEHVGTPAVDKRLSSALLRMPRGWQRTFFDAYAVGDGCVRGAGKEEGTVRCVSASAALLRGMRLLLARQGLAASINGRHNKKATWYTGKPIYELAVSGGQLCGRGTPKSYLHPEGYILSSVRKIEQYDWQGEVYDLTVEEDSSFTASGIIAHNSNINGDHFPEAALIHAPDRWTGTPLVDRISAKKWPYGYPTFYNAFPYAHHRNKDPSRAFGQVELASWNDNMKRVELVCRVDHDKCQQFGGTGVWDRLTNGHYPDVSMGTKVPYDTCFPAGTLIRTPSGHKAIELLEAGDTVITHTGAARRVTATMQSQAEALTQVKLYGLPTVKATSNHPFLALRKEQARSCVGTVGGQRTRHTFDGRGPCTRCGKDVDYDLQWVAAEDLRVGDYLCSPVQHGEQGDYVDPTCARLLGYYLGDGHIIKQRRGKKKQGEYYDVGVGFTVGYDSPEHLDRIVSTLVEFGVANEPNMYDVGSGRGAWTVNVYDQKLASWLQHFGGRSSSGKFVSSDVLSWSTAARSALIGGYLDTDGSYDANKKSARLLSSNRGLALDMQFVLHTLGVPASVGPAGEGGGYGTDTKMWHVLIPASSVSAFYDYAAKIPSEVGARAGSQTFFRSGYWFAPIRSVESVEEECTVYNLSVEGDESYLAEGRAVHNCSICLDWDLYRKALDTFDPKRHTHPGQAALQYHKKLKARDGKGIRGLSVTRKDYCEHAKSSMNKILPDGRKVWVYNDYPRFFDISFVFIGADKTAKVMLFVFRNGNAYSVKPSAQVADEMEVEEPKDDSKEKTASVGDELLKRAFGKLAKPKFGEIEKDVVPSHFAGKAVPILTKSEPRLSKSVLDRMASVPLKNSLSTTASMGMVLSPSEFQRLVLTRMGKRDVADQLESNGCVFCRSYKSAPMGLSSDMSLPLLTQLLLPMLAARSSLGPVIEKRVVIMSMPKGKLEPPKGEKSEDLDKIAEAYNGYREELIDVVAGSSSLLSGSSDQELSKLGSADVEELFTPLSVSYLQEAFLDEFGVLSPGVVKLSGKPFSVERGLPLENTRQ